MKKTLLYALVGTFALAGVVETTPQASAEPALHSPRTLDQLRETVRGQAIADLAAGDTQTVGHSRYHRRRASSRRRWVPRRYTLRYIHRGGRWCGRGRWYGRRCYYTPRALRPFRR
jgi:hypothetical protein